MSAPVQNRTAVSPLALEPGSEDAPRELTLAERGAAAEREFARLEAARRAAMAEKLEASRQFASPPLGVSHRTPRASPFDSRLGEAVSQRSQRSHRTPRESTSPLKSQNVYERSHRTPRETSPLKSQKPEDMHFSRVLQYGGTRQMNLQYGGQRRPLGPY